MLRRRLMNVAKAEATHAAARLQAAARGLWALGRASVEGELDEELSRIRAEVEAEEAFAPGMPTETSEVRRFYANLELPLGASVDEVKAAYRRLMRRYHPDKHSKDPEQARAATVLAQELRQAYEGLLRHLGVR